MEKLDTIQKHENLNTVCSLDDPGPGGACHRYVINMRHANAEKLCSEILKVYIQFQRGPRRDPASVSGVIDTDLLEIVRDRLKAFQTGEFATRENAIALTHIEEALMWMNRRVEDRIERNVLGTMNK